MSDLSVRPTLSQDLTSSPRREIPLKDFLIVVTENCHIVDPTLRLSSETNDLPKKEAATRPKQRSRGRGARKERGEGGNRFTVSAVDERTQATTLSVEEPPLPRSRDDGPPVAAQREGRSGATDLPVAHPTHPETGVVKLRPNSPTSTGPQRRFT